MNTLKKETPALLLVLLPFVYALLIYGDLPAQVPHHFNAAGEIDSWGSKAIIWILPLFTVVLTYILFTIIPKIDPKKQLQSTDSKFVYLKYVMLLFLSTLTLYLMYAIKEQSLLNTSFMYALIGFLFLGVGNFLPSIKPNYFVGLRTPWTLENAIVWKKTHRFMGKLWVVLGLTIILMALLLPSEQSLYFFLALLAAGILIPFLYSFSIYKKLTREV